MSFIPNGLSILRVVLLYPFYIVYLNFMNDQTLINQIYIISFAIFIAFTDYLDGYFARKLNVTSESGKILDPLADKVAIIFTAWLFSTYDTFPVWLFWIILGRDILILIGATALMGKIKEIPSSEWPGKITSFILTCLFVAYLLQFRSIIPFIEFVSVLSIVYSFLDYILKFLRLNKSENK